MMRRAFHSRSGLAAAFLLLVFSSALQAKVFRGGGSASDDFSNGSLPWETASRTRMTVNGRPAVMHIYSARFSEPVEEQLRARFEAMGAKVTIMKSRDGATGTAKWPDREARFLVLAPHTEPRQHIMVSFTEPDAKLRKVRFPVPEYPRGKTGTTISDDDSGTFLATIETADSATDIHAFYAQQLQTEGWNMVSPPVIKDGRISGMAAYEKKKKVCYVQASERAGGVNMITLLVKGGTL